MTGCRDEESHLDRGEGSSLETMNAISPLRQSIRERKESERQRR